MPIIKLKKALGFKKRSHKTLKSGSYNSDQSKSMFRWAKKLKTAPSYDSGTTISSKGPILTSNPFPAATGNPNLKGNRSVPSTVLAHLQPSNVNGESSIVSYAAAAAKVAKEFFVENPNPATNALYMPSKSPKHTTVAYPTLYNRKTPVENDVTLEKENTLCRYSISQDHDFEEGNGRQAPYTEGARSLYSRAPLVAESLYESKVTYSDKTDTPCFPEYLHKNRRILTEPKHALPASSIAGSMLYKDTVKSACNTRNLRREIISDTPGFLSPQKPTGLPANTIMASMLFRTMQTEEIPKNVSALMLKDNVDANLISAVACASPRDKEPHTKNLLSMMNTNIFKEFGEESHAKNRNLYEA